MARPFRIRQAVLADKPEVSALLGASYAGLMAASYAPGVLAAALPIITVAQDDLLASRTYFVAVGEPDSCASESGAVVGCGGWTPERPGQGAIRTEGVGHIRHFATDPAWIGRGVGRAIMAASIESARRSGVRRLDVLSSLNAEAFYAALGFLTRGPRVVMLAGVVPFPSVDMSRTIEASDIQP